tara:strand:- start:430 stop:1542 length:1113 start_codon:yes stop_codon:yes gene_type:complete
MKYLVSGYGPGTGGVNKLVEYLASLSNSDQCKLYYPKVSSVKNKYVKKIIENIFYRPWFRLKVRSLKNCDVVIIMQQSVGYNTVDWLIKNCSKVSIYIMDNGFFCVKAYNYLNAETGECLKCVGGDFTAAKSNKCQPRPTNFRKRAIALQELLYRNSRVIEFLALSETNAKLLTKHFGKDVNVNALYFNTLDFDSLINRDQQLSSEVYDVVFHAGDITEKGFEYCLELASYLPDHHFFIPTNTLPAEYSYLTNITHAAIRWETGLEGIVSSARLVLTPSLWSYTPEAATLKSMICNGSVGMVKTEFGFCNEVDEGAFLSLTGDAKSDAVTINEFLSGEKSEELRRLCANYIHQYFSRARKDMISLVQDKS